MSAQSKEQPAANNVVSLAERMNRVARPQISDAQKYDNAVTAQWDQKEKEIILAFGF